MTDALVNTVLRAPTGLSSRLRVAVLRALGARIGRRCRLVGTRVPQNPWDVALGDGVALDAGVVLLALGPRRTTPRITVGPRTYVNRGTMVDAALSVAIGADVMIGPRAYITDHDHGTGEGPVAAAPLVAAPVAIGDGVWLGAGVVVLKGVSIGARAVVGAGSVVTRDVAPGARVAGAPARPLRAGAQTAVR